MGRWRWAGRRDGVLYRDGKKRPSGESKRQHQTNYEDSRHETLIRFRGVGSRIAARIADALTFLDHSVARVAASHVLLERKITLLVYRHSVPSFGTITFRYLLWYVADARTSPSLTGAFVSLEPGLNLVPELRPGPGQISL